MFAVCSTIGLFSIGWYGVLLGALVSLIEKIPWFDDNVTVPIFSASFLYLIKLI
jgi:dolichol kinase